MEDSQISTIFMESQDDFIYYISKLNQAFFGT